MDTETDPLPSIFGLSLIAPRPSASDSPPVRVHRSARTLRPGKPEVDRRETMAWERRGAQAIGCSWSFAEKKMGRRVAGRKETRESQDKFAPRVTVWPRAAGQTSAFSVQCHDGRSGAQIIHNCIGNAADVECFDVADSPSRTNRGAREPRKLGRGCWTRVTQLFSRKVILRNIC